MTYKVSLRKAMDQLDSTLRTHTTQAAEERAQDSYAAAHALIREPWEAQVKKLRRRSGPHVNAELLRLATMGTKKEVLRSLEMEAN